jgi:hypothetical protein
MKIESNKINFRSLDAHNVEIYHDTDRIRFWTGPMKVPFGIDENFGKHYIRVELDEDSKQDAIFKKIIEKIEGIMIKRLNIGEGQLKKIIRRKVGNKDIADIRVKQIKNNVLTECEYENPRDNYLKTLFDIEKGDIVKIDIYFTSHINNITYTFGWKLDSDTSYSYIATDGDNNYVLNNKQIFFNLKFLALKFLFS